jgi:uncharacterized membrane protein
MPSPSERPVSPRAFALCLLVCASLQIMEGLLPRLPVFPWLKLGLSHIVLLPFLLRFGAVAAGSLLVGRNLLSLLFAAGSLSTFLIGTLSGLAALAVAGALVRAAAGRGLLGLAGAGMIMAALMNLAQLAVVEGLFIRHAAFWFQLAPMLAWSAVSGAAVAWLAHRARPVLEGLFEEQGDVVSASEAGSPARGSRAFLACLAALAALFILPGPEAQGAALAAMVAFAAWRGALRAGLSALVRAWPWFLYLAWLHLFLGDGEYLVEGWITRPGAEAFLACGARLATLVLLGPHLAAAFPRRWLAGSASAYARGMMAALPLLPGLHAAAVGAGRAFLRALREAWRPAGAGASAAGAAASAAAGTARGSGPGRRLPGEAEVLRGLADGFRAAVDGRPPPQ